MAIKIGSNEIETDVINIIIMEIWRNDKYIFRISNQ